MYNWPSSRLVPSFLITSIFQTSILSDMSCGTYTPILFTSGVFMRSLLGGNHRKQYLSIFHFWSGVWTRVLCVYMRHSNGTLKGVKIVIDFRPLVDELYLARVANLLTGNLFSTSDIRKATISILYYRWYTVTNIMSKVTIKVLLWSYELNFISKDLSRCYC